MPPKRSRAGLIFKGERNFGGKTYKRYFTYRPPVNKLSIAKRGAAIQRKEGFLARITKAKDTQGNTVFILWRYKDSPPRYAKAPIKKRAASGGPIHVRAHQRRGSRGVRAHTRKRPRRR